MNTFRKRQPALLFLNLQLHTSQRRSGCFPAAPSLTALTHLSLSRRDRERDPSDRVLQVRAATCPVTVRLIVVLPAPLHHPSTRAVYLRLPSRTVAEAGEPLRVKPERPGRPPGRGAPERGINEAASRMRLTWAALFTRNTFSNLANV